MDAGTVLSQLTIDADGWTAPLDGGPTFLGLPVNIHVQTEDIPAPSPRDLDDRERTAATTVLGQLETTMLFVEAAFRKYHEQESPWFIETAHNPYVWIYFETMDYDGPDRWTFVVEASQAKDYGTHIEMKGAEVIDVWSGD